jgi:hypothetical protein
VNFLIILIFLFSWLLVLFFGNLELLDDEASFERFDLVDLKFGLNRFVGGGRSEPCRSWSCESERRENREKNGDGYFFHFVFVV